MVVKLKYSLLVLFLLAASPLFLTVANVSAQGGKGTPPALNEKVLNQLKLLGEEKKSRTPAQRKMSSQLVHAVKLRRGDPQLRGLPGLKSQVKVAADDTTLVDIKAVVTPPLLEKIESLGGTVINSYAEYNAIRARVPLDALETLAAGAEVRNIRQASKPLLRQTNTSEGDVAHKADVARSATGFNGSGVKVGVLSDSVDYLAAVQVSGDLPAVTVVQDAPGNSGEGTAMLEIVHDLAPGAELYFATAWNGKAGFASNIKKLANAGCQVIVDDVGYLDESPFQDDIVSQAVNTVTSRGVLYFSSAGNAGNLSKGTSGVWEGDYNGQTINFGGTPVDVHNFSGIDWTNQITFDATGCYTLFWSDPLGASNNDYDLYLLNPTADTIVAESSEFQTGTQDPFEGFCVTELVSDYNLMVTNFGAEPRFLHLSANGGELEYGTTGQITGHPAAENAFAVAAVSVPVPTTPFVGTETVESSTSDGPRLIFYAADGTPVTPGNFLATGGIARQKPDITAADCVSTATPNFSPFCGTSASAPHAAAMGALMISANPSVTLPLVRQIFQNTALDIETAGRDNLSGYGIVMADTVVDAADALPAPDWFLTVSKEGIGSGTVVSAPAGIDCGTDCVGAYYNASVVTLHPIPSNNSLFTGWSGDADCADGQVTMTSDVACTANFEKKYPWPMFLPAMTRKHSETYWGALSYVYCGTSTATFSLSSSGVTKTSVCQAGGCAGGTGTFEGWVTTTPGLKSFSYGVSSSTCGSVAGSFNYTLAEGKNYLFSLDLNAAGQPAVYVSIATGKPQGARLSAVQLNSAEAQQVGTGALNGIDEIPLDLAKGKFASSRKNITGIIQ